MAQKTLTDVFGIMMGFDEDEFSVETEKKSADEALIDCLNKFGGVDMRYLMSATGLSADSVASELRGAIYQDPEKFLDLDSYDATVGWVISARYFSGNIRYKLMYAKRANYKFRGKFVTNIMALEKLLPKDVSLDKIHINLGASWIPEEEYAEFMYTFFGFSEIPAVTYRKELKRWDVKLCGRDERSVVNTITYGVTDDKTFSYEGKPKQYLTAVEIIEQTLNAKTVKVYDYIPRSYTGKDAFDYEPVLNKNKTVEAQEKQKVLCEAFKDWVYSDEARIANFEAYYNETFVGYTYSAYDGSFLKLPGLNPKIKFYPHQLNAIARVLLSAKNVLFAHDVGAGKTYEMVASVHELKRLRLSEKNMVVVPNNILKATEKAHRLLYPDDKILVVYPKDFSPLNRVRTLLEIRDGDYVAVYIAYSSFDMIVMSKDYHVNKMKAEISSVSSAAFHATDKREKRALEAKERSLRKKLDKFIEEADECPWPTYDKLGITTLVVDEAHNYKNISFQASADNIVGMSKKGSKKCVEMLEKVHFTDRVIFATGTPLTNSLADLYTFQLYLQPSTLAAHDISTFDSWINTFGQRETSIECDVDANSKGLRTVTRFASFHNLGELMSLFSQVCDFHHIDDGEGLPKFSGHVDVCTKKSQAQSVYIKSLSDRTERIRNKKVSRTVDNLLKVTTDGRKAAIDIRLIEGYEHALCEKESKISACADKIFELYLRYNDCVQIVFSDLGTPKTSFNVYDALREELMGRGVAPHEIAFVHDAITESARAKLFEDMNSAKLKVVIGSTQKLGVGVNVQERLVALHHLSVPWKPSDMVQREGRILRKGNTCPEIFIYRYITEGTFDAYLWQLLENKQKFISSFLSGTSAARDMDDIANTVLNYAEVKALAIGNPLIKKRVEVANLLDRKKIASRTRQSQMQKLHVVIEVSKEEIVTCRNLAVLSEKDYDAYSLRRKQIPNAERQIFGEELLFALRSNGYYPKDREFEKTYQGFAVILPAQMNPEHPYVLIKSENGGCYYCSMSGEKTPKGCTMSIDRVLDGLYKESEKQRDRAAELEKRISSAKEDLDKGNVYVDEIEKLAEKLADIDKTLEDLLNSEESA